MTYLGIRLVPIPQDKQANFPIAAGLPCWKCPFPSYFTGTLLAFPLTTPHACFTFQRKSCTLIGMASRSWVPSVCTVSLHLDARSINQSINQSDKKHRVLTLAIIIPAIFEAKRRQYPAVIHVYLAICGHALGWAYLMPAFVGYEESFCESPYLAAGHKHGKCAVQGTRNRHRVVMIANEYSNYDRCNGSCYTAVVRGDDI